MTEMKIWKFPLKERTWQSIEMPTGARVLSVGEQHGQLCLWAMVEPHKGLDESRVFAIFGTGEAFPTFEGHFIGTTQMLDGAVLHLFEVTEQLAS